MADWVAKSPSSDVELDPADLADDEEDEEEEDEDEDEEEVTDDDDGDVSVSSSGSGSSNSEEEEEEDNSDSLNVSFEGSNQSEMSPSIAHSTSDLQVQSNNQLLGNSGAILDEKLDLDSLLNTNKDDGIVSVPTIQITSTESESGGCSPVKKLKVSQALSPGDESDEVDEEEPLERLLLEQDSEDDICSNTETVELCDMDFTAIDRTASLGSTSAKAEGLLESHVDPDTLPEFSCDSESVAAHQEVTSTKKSKGKKSKSKQSKSEGESSDKTVKKKRKKKKAVEGGLDDAEEGEKPKKKRKRKDGDKDSEPKKKKVPTATLR